MWQQVQFLRVVEVWPSMSVRVLFAPTFPSYLRFPLFVAGSDQPALNICCFRAVCGCQIGNCLIASGSGHRVIFWSKLAKRTGSASSRNRSSPLPSSFSIIRWSGPEENSKEKYENVGFLANSEFTTSAIPNQWTTFAPNSLRTFNRPGFFRISVADFTSNSQSNFLVDHVKKTGTLNLLLSK